MEREQFLEKYNKNTHLIGRIVSVTTLLLLVGAPFLIGNYLGALPDLGAAAKGFLAVGIVWTASSVVEFLVYTPMLGAGGGYLAFITGNLIKLGFALWVELCESPVDCNIVVIDFDFVYEGSDHFPDLFEVIPC